MDKIYGVFDGEYSDWGIRGFFNTRDEAEKYCCLHTDCYIKVMSDLSNKEDLSDIKVFYEQEIGFELEKGNLKLHDIDGMTSGDCISFTKTIRMRNEPDRYNFYSAEQLRDNHIEFNFNYGWIYFHINTTRADDRKRCEKIAQDYLAELYGDKGIITKEDINAMNKRFAEVRY